MSTRSRDRLGVAIQLIRGGGRCKHCQALGPEWQKASTSIPYDEPVILGVVNVDEQDALKDEFAAGGKWPSIVKFPRSKGGKKDR